MNSWAPFPLRLAIGTVFAVKVLEELELNQPKEVLEVQCVDEIEVRATVWVEPGNFSDRDGHKHVGMSSRISEESLVTVFQAPLRVGDVYRVTFDKELLDLAPCYAHCRRCYFVNEETFESTLVFLESVNLRQ